MLVILGGEHTTCSGLAIVMGLQRIRTKHFFNIFTAQIFGQHCVGWIKMKKLTKSTLSRNVFDNKPPVVWSCLWFWQESASLVVAWQFSWASRESGENVSNTFTAQISGQNGVGWRQNGYKLTKGTLARNVFENKPPVVWSCLWFWEESTPLVVVWQL